MPSVPSIRLLLTSSQHVRQNGRRGVEMSFGSKVRELRCAAGFTLRELAEKTNLDFTYLSKMETGKLRYTPAADAIRSVATALNADPIELLALADKLPPELGHVSTVP